MRKFLIVFALLYGTNATAQPPRVPRVPSAPDDAVIELTVPADARVWFDGNATTRAGTVRRYTVNMAGYTNDGIYTVKVTSNGRTWERDILVRAGQTTRATFGEEVSLQAVPFVLPGDLRQTADDEPAWPVGLSFLRGMERYHRATRTQHSARRFVGFIVGVPRERVDQKWNIPGGLVGVRGWSSTLYRTPGMTTRAYLGYTGGDVISWQRTYRPGSVFADVLRNDRGHIFEVRVAERERHGVWNRYVAFRDINQRPAGYVPPTSRECRECHENAGAVVYGGDAVPGHDSVFSEPIAEVEDGVTRQGGNGLQL